MNIARWVGTLGLVVGVGLAAPAYAQDTTTRVSLGLGQGQGNGAGHSPDISAEGGLVVFTSAATNLVPADTNTLDDIFVRDRALGTTVRVSVRTDGTQATGGNSSHPSISENGRFVAFGSSATNLVANDTNGREDIFVRDLLTRTTTRVSVSSNGTQAAASSFSPEISGDGRYVVFASNASNLVSGDTNGETDVFLHDRDAGTTVRVSVATGGGQALGGGSVRPSMSIVGTVVSFHSDATNLAPGDTNNKSDVFVRDLSAGTTTRISVGPGGVEANDLSVDPSVSFSGRFITFVSRATNLDASGLFGIFVHDRQNQVTSAVEVVPDGPGPDLPSSPRISGDGQYICLTMPRVPGFSVEDVFLIERMTLTKTRVNVPTSGTFANDTSSQCAITADASAVAYESRANNLVDQDTNGASDVFVRTIAPTMTLDRTALAFAALTSGGTFASQPSARTVRLTQHGGGDVSWTAVSNQPWLHVSPAAGGGSETLSITVTPFAGMPASGAIEGAIVLSLTGAANTLNPISVTLTLIPHGTSLTPFGVVDTPTDHRTGVTGAIPFTGWALDDIEVTRVSICRDAFGAEVAPTDPNCGGAAEIFVGFGVFIDGARPDVAANVPSFPLATRAGWGFMVLTNMLPNQGNGTYRFTVRAQDHEGHTVILGTRTMTCANASATLPFGTIDTPEQGGVASGAIYPSFGWALTPQPKTIPLDGSTIQVLVDGVSVGTADYNHARPDIQAAFPGFNNTNGAVGFRLFDTRQLTNGLHTISWTVTDNQGAVEGIGSRFFTVSNTLLSKVTAAMSAQTPAAVEATPLETSPLVGRRGWDLDAPYGLFEAGATGVTVIRSEEVNRVELRLGDGEYTGYLRTPSGLVPLPIGSRLDVTTNTFTWAPGVGFVGRYDFVFVRSASGHAVSRREVRIILHPKGRGAVGPQVVIDLPRANAVVSSPFMIGGWAVDLDATEGTGVTTLHAWAYPATGGAPIFLGATAYGGARPDVAAVQGDRFTDSGFGLIVQGLSPGEYDLAVFAWSTEIGGFVAPKVVRVTVNP
jgi:Tol biopolymer transport system component